MKKTKKRQLKKGQIYKKKQLMIICILVICFLSIIVIFGRYITNNINDFFIRSKEFYFYSDKLKETRADYQIDNWSGVDDYVITINMNSNKNNLEKATYDISYDISYSCSTNAICQLSKTQGIIYESTNTDFFNLTITPNTQLNTGDRVIIDVEVASTAHYEKTLKGRFTLIVGKEDLTYQITDQAQNPYMELSLTNTLTYYTISEAFNSYNVGDRIDIDTYLALTQEQKAKCYSSIVTISFDPMIILPDLTSNMYQKATNIKYITIDGQEYVNELTINIDAISSENLRFYKVDDMQDYTYPNSTGKSVVTINSI